MHRLKDDKSHIVILGAGNVATQLALVLNKSNTTIQFIYNRSIASAKDLALKVNADYSDNLYNIPDDADLYIIAVKDEAIDEIAKNLKIKTGIVVHTSGGRPLEVLSAFQQDCGVFYPLQTFTKNRIINFAEVPIFIEANNKKSKQKLFNLAHQISSKVMEVDSEKRKMIHLAAVFSCNFVNHMFSISSELMKKTGCSLELLKPLIQETVNKAMDLQPENAQTGPAVRNDKMVMENHLKLLKEYPEFEKIYRFVSESIYKSQSKKEI